MADHDEPCNCEQSLRLAAEVGYQKLMNEKLQAAYCALETENAILYTRIETLEGRLEDRTNAWHDRDLRSGAETERAAVVAYMRSLAVDQPDCYIIKAAGMVDLIGCIESGAHHSSKEGG